jgi:hypothetical protein
MIANKYFKAIALTMGLSGLVACGGGGGDNVAGIGGTGITASGTITGFGSIFVNGIEFETTGASISVDDAPANESDLKLGMVVKVQGVVDANGLVGVASSVLFDDEVQGPLTLSNPQPASLDGLAKEMMVMGITVIADRTTTTYENTSFDTLVDGDVIEVSGYFDAAGVLQATRIEEKAGVTVEVKGVASYSGGTQFTLDIDADSLSDFTVNTGVVSIPSGLDGSYVEVEGTLNILPATIDATRIELEDEDLFEQNSGAVSLEGIISEYDFLNDTAFRVAGVAVSVDYGSVVLEPTNLVLANGMEVEVEGNYVGATLIAENIENEASEVKVYARVNSVDTNTQKITVQYFNGSTLDVSYDNDTQLEDDLDNPLYSYSNMANPDFLKIEGYLDDLSNIVAKDIQRLSQVQEDELLEGPADSGTCTGAGISVLGVSFNFDAGTSYEDTDDVTSISNGAFCTGAAVAGVYVKIIDDVGDGVDGNADEAELED